MFFPDTALSCRPRSLHGGGREGATGWGGCGGGAGGEGGLGGGGGDGGLDGGDWQMDSVGDGTRWRGASGPGRHVKELYSSALWGKVSVGKKAHAPRSTHRLVRPGPGTVLPNARTMPINAQGTSPLSRLMLTSSSCSAGSVARAAGMEPVR